MTSPNLPHRSQAVGSELTNGLRGGGTREAPAPPRPADRAGSLGAPSAPSVTSGTATRPGGPRRARLTIRRVDPWSVLKFTLLFTLCLLVVGVVAVAALYAALDRLEVFDAINNSVKNLTQEGSGASATGGVEIYFRPKTIIGGAALLGLLNTIIMTALATLCAFLYNLVADIVGGIEVVLGEHD